MLAAYLREHEQKHEREDIINASSKIYPPYGVINKSVSVSEPYLCKESVSKSVRPWPCSLGVMRWFREVTVQEQC